MIRHRKTISLALKEIKDIYKAYLVAMKDNKVEKDEALVILGEIGEAVKAIERVVGDVL